MIKLIQHKLFRHSQAQCTGLQPAYNMMQELMLQGVLASRNARIDSISILATLALSCRLIDTMQCLYRTVANQ